MEKGEGKLKEVKGGDLRVGLKGGAKKEIKGWELERAFQNLYYPQAQSNFL